MMEDQASRQVAFIRRGEPRPGVPSGTTHIVVEHESVRIIHVRAFEWVNMFLCGHSTVHTNGRYKSGSDQFFAKLLAIKRSIAAY